MCFRNVWGHRDSKAGCFCKGLRALVAKKDVFYKFAGATGLKSDVFNMFWGTVLCTTFLGHQVSKVGWEWGSGGSLPPSWAYHFVRTNVVRIRHAEPETRNQEPGTRSQHQKPGTRNQKTGTRTQKLTKNARKYQGNRRHMGKT